MYHAFFTARTTDGTSAVLNIKDGGYSLLKVDGVFDGATVSIEVDFGDGLFATLSDTFTAEDVKYVQLKAEMNIKITIAGAGGSTSLNVNLI